MAQTETTPQWRADLLLLRSWAGSDERLAPLLGVEVGTIRKWATQLEPGYDKERKIDRKQEIRDLRERWEEEHVQSAERIALMEQLLIELEKANDMYEVETICRRTKKILDKKDDALCEA